MEANKDFLDRFADELKKKVRGTLQGSQDIIQDTARIVKESLLGLVSGSGQFASEAGKFIVTLVDTVIYTAREIGMDLGAVSKGILLGVMNAAKELSLNAFDLVYEAASEILKITRKLGLDIGSVLKNFIEGTLEGGKDIVKKLFSSKSQPQEKSTYHKVA